MVAIIFLSTVLVKGEFRLDHVLYDNWLFVTLFLFPTKKRGKKKRRKKYKTGFKPISLDFHPDMKELLTVCYCFHCLQTYYERLRDLKQITLQNNLIV